MSYGKARELIDLMLDIAGRRSGMALSEIDGRWGADNADSARRRTQRALDALRALLPAGLGEEMRPGEGKVVHLSSPRLGDLPVADPADMAALLQGAAVLRNQGDEDGAERLERLGRQLEAAAARRGPPGREVDLEVLLEARHMLARPGPRPAVDPAVTRALADALLKGNRAAFDYVAGKGASRRVVNPYGLIVGGRTYLVACPVSREGGEPSRWRVDRMANVKVLPEAAVVPEDFVLSDYAARAFGAWYTAHEYGEVVWRFAPEAAAQAEGFHFHPGQRLERQADGSLVVRFCASGHLEMAWFLYQWGDKVEVLAPPALRALTEGHRRADFPALP